MTATTNELVLAAGDARCTVDVGAGGRISSLLIGDAELIWSGRAGTDDRDPLHWGCYPMVPFAGRILHGQFSFEGHDFTLPSSLGGNAIHGYGFVNPWRQVDDNTITWDFIYPWPFAGRATQRFELAPDALMLQMSIEAIERQPILVGWHPWFAKQNTAGVATLNFPAAQMYERDEDGMPGQLIPTLPGPWDDCFTKLADTPSISWGDLNVTLRSNLDHWVVYDEPVHGLCVEPQSGPPNEINHSPRILEAGETFTATFTLEFSTT